MHVYNEDTKHKNRFCDEQKRITSLLWRYFGKICNRTFNKLIDTYIYDIKCPYQNY